MTDDPIRAGLLPEGLRDRLPPQAYAEAALVASLMDCFEANGFERVDPPLIEFEDSLSGRLSNADRRDFFRFVDPISQRTMSIRTDMTTQIGRIATTRLADLARPLRLAYAGSVVCVRGTQLRADRESTQIGVEAIGNDSVPTISEVVLLALAALTSAGLAEVTLDLVLPDLLGMLMDGPWPIEGRDRAAVYDSLDGKDVAALRAAGAPQYEALIAAIGPVDVALGKLRALNLSGEVERLLDDVATLADAVEHAHPGIGVTLDPTERHGFNYQTRIGFSILSRRVRGEVGRGGTYKVTHPDDHAEPAVGCSLYLDGLVDAGLGAAPRRRLLVAADSPPTLLQQLQQDGWATVRSGSAPNAAEARAQRCTHMLDGKMPREI